MIFSALELDGKIRLTERREEQNVVYKKEDAEGVGLSAQTR